MKLLKTIGKVIALPFDLALILGKLLLIPIKLVSVYSVGFTDENGNFSERIETFKITKDSVQHYIDYAKASLKQESA